VFWRDRLGLPVRRRDEVVELSPRSAVQEPSTRGDNKESWDNIDIFGWLGYPMQIKIDFMCRDSILAHPWSSTWCSSQT
jgi:myo-inositol-1-phosphate synthase